MHGAVKRRIGQLSLMEAIFHAVYLQRTTHYYKYVHNALLLFSTGTVRACDDRERKGTIPGLNQARQTLFTFIFCVCGLARLNVMRCRRRCARSHGRRHVSRFFQEVTPLGSLSWEELSMRPAPGRHITRRN